MVNLAQLLWACDEAVQHGRKAQWSKTLHLMVGSEREIRKELWSYYPLQGHTP
jgi:hypothetical protein